MKKFTTILALGVALSLMGCSDSSGDKASGDVKKEKRKSTSLKHKDNMLNKLVEYKIVLPDVLTFKEIKRRGSEYTAVFVATAVDAGQKKNLDSWYTNQMSKLEANGWKRSKHGNTENQKMAGLTINSYIFMKPKGGGSTRTLALTLSSISDPKASKYTVKVSPAQY
jgi:protein involved in sex pheromone biosynthesis